MIKESTRKSEFNVLVKNIFNCMLSNYVLQLRKLLECEILSKSKNGNV